MRSAVLSSMNSQVDALMNQYVFRIDGMQWVSPTKNHRTHPQKFFFFLLFLLGECVTLAGTGYACDLDAVADSCTPSGFMATDCRCKKTGEVFDQESKTCRGSLKNNG